MLNSLFKTKFHLKNVLSIVIMSFFTILLLMKMSPVSNRDLATWPSASLYLPLRVQLNCGNPQRRNTQATLNALQDQGCSFVHRGV